MEVRLACSANPGNLSHVQMKKLSGHVQVKKNGWKKAYHTIFTDEICMISIFFQFFCQ